MTDFPAPGTEWFPDSGTFLGADTLFALPAASGWHVTHLDSGPGPLVSCTIVRRTAAEGFIEAISHNPLELRGSMPAGMGAVLLTDPGGGVRCCGNILRHGQIGVILGGEKSVTLIPPHTTFHVAILSEAFITSNLGLIATYRMRRDSITLMNSSIGIIESARNSLVDAQSPTSVSARGKTAQDDVVTCLETLLKGAIPEATPTGSRQAYQVLVAAESYIDAHLNETISLAELSQHTGVSPRSLQRLFRQVLGTSPISYIRKRRLNAVRQILIDDRTSGQTITNAAISCGFRHLGRFAAEYKAYFGKFPSEPRTHMATWK